MRKLLAALLAVLLAATAAQAQERPAYSQAELDQMLAPVALYPDALLSQVLMASTYPLEVVEAARWSRANPGLLGDEAVRAAADKEWDPSIKSLLAFPHLLSRMDEKLDWTRRLGDAFLAQEAQVMDTVQQLRRRAQDSGHLLPDERQRVAADGSTIVIEPADPRVVYVPYYDPYVVYGPWWWSAYPPVMWAPYYGYAVVRPGFWWGVGVGITAGFFYGGMDWHHHHVNVVHANSYYVRPPVARYGVAGGPAHRTRTLGAQPVAQARHRLSQSRSAEEIRRGGAAPGFPPGSASWRRRAVRAPRRAARRPPPDADPTGTARLATATAARRGPSPGAARAGHAPCLHHQRDAALRSAPGTQARSTQRASRAVEI